MNRPREAIPKILLLLITVKIPAQTKRTRACYDVPGRPVNSGSDDDPAYGSIPKLLPITVVLSSFKQYSGAGEFSNSSTRSPQSEGGRGRNSEQARWAVSRVLCGCTILWNENLRPAPLLPPLIIASYGRTGWSYATTPASREQSPNNEQ